MVFRSRKFCRMTRKWQIAHKKGCYKIPSLMSQPLKTGIHAWKIITFQTLCTSKESNIKLELCPLADLVNQVGPAIPEGKNHCLNANSKYINLFFHQMKMKKMPVMVVIILKGHQNRAAPARSLNFVETFANTFHHKLYFPIRQSNNLSLSICHFSCSPYFQIFSCFFCQLLQQKDLCGYFLAKAVLSRSPAMPYDKDSWLTLEFFVIKQNFHSGRGSQSTLCTL